MFQIDLKRNTLNSDGSIKNGFEWDHRNPECYKRIDESTVQGQYFLTTKKIGASISVAVLSKEKGEIKVGDYLYLVNNSGSFLGNPAVFTKNNFLFQYKLICNKDGQIAHFHSKSRVKLVLVISVVTVVLGILSQMGN